MGDSDLHAVVVFVTGQAGEHLDGLRRQWDPDDADRIDPHVTVAYPEEGPDRALLRARLDAAARRLPAFPLRLRAVVAHEQKPSRGVYHLVEDPAGLFDWLREFVLAPPFVPRNLVPHATITHPRSPGAGRRAFKELEGVDPDLEFRVGELSLVTFDGSRWAVDERYSLGGVDLSPP